MTANPHICLIAAAEIESIRVPAQAMSFVRNHCLDCHDGESGEGGFDVESLAKSLADEGNVKKWVRVFDRVQNGEMPPPDEGRLAAGALKRFLPPLSKAIDDAQRQRHASDGRVQSRRLTNRQLQNTLNDLLCIDVPLAATMSPEQRTHGFVHLAETQTMSHFHLQSHLSVVDAALDAAFDRAMEADQSWQLDLPAKKIANKRPGQRNREPEMRNELAVTWSSRMPFYGRIRSTKVPESGWYRIKLKASAIKPPAEHGVWCSVRSGECTAGAPLMTWIGGFEATNQAKDLTYQAWLPKGHLLEIRPCDVTLKKAITKNGQVGYGECESQDVSGVGLHQLNIERVFPGGDVATVRKRLFGSVPLVWDKKLKRSFPDVSAVGPSATQAYLAKQLARFAQYAFRRPASPEDLKLFVGFALDTIKEHHDLPRGQAYYQGLRAGYRVILCSPRFLYFTEPADESGRLDSWAIASRLSYFLCNTTPDKELLLAARLGRLDDPNELRRQTDRLLATPAGKSFIPEFTAHWLDLIDIDFTEPDKRLFNDFDIAVQDAMLSETHLFLGKLLKENRPIAELVNADYTFLNNRLARYYGIDGELQKMNVDVSDQMQLVSFSGARPGEQSNKNKVNSRRGGLLAHGSILKVTANGNDTSPVLRGIWVCERILGMEIPPPPANVPAVEPDIRGATTIRELLAKHEADTSCASCHKNFDPPGFALENFDAGGKWRDQYRQLVKGKYKRGGKVDPSYQMVDGRKFNSFDQYREMIAGDADVLARNLASQFLVYATGATIQFSDRTHLDAIVAGSRRSRYGVRSILDEVIASKPFLHK
ncbi:DUF1592 domain-containing protein [Neorhodopirellula lusitana]|uniref:DUF1592 domain-containing protein n=1 Tax=Neorhodopirellula lusitana TaxID=445327 RepID=UPI00384B8B29